MFARTAFLTSAAVLVLGSAPAFAQDAMTQSPPPAPQTAEPAAAPAAGTMQIQPGSEVKGSDGMVLGKLEGVHTVNGAQELKVRGSDGVLRGVPLSGLKPDGAGIAVAWTTPEFESAAPITEPAPPADAPPATDGTITDGTDADTPAEPASPPVSPQA